LNCALWVPGARLARSDADRSDWLLSFSELVVGESRRVEGIRAALRASAGQVCGQTLGIRDWGEGL
jgi:hypothetical protein